MKKFLLLSTLLSSLFSVNSCAGLFNGSLTNNYENYQDNCSSVSSNACKTAYSLKHGINLGDMLDAPSEGKWGVTFRDYYADKIAEHFQNVRLPIRWSSHASSDQDAIIDEAFFQRVEHIVNLLLSKNLYVIINMHHYKELYNDTNPIYQQRFLNMWKQIAQRFKSKSDKLIFELLNEPHGKIDFNKWNQLYPQALEIVRQTNPSRIVLLSHSSYNAKKGLNQLQLPAQDKNIIVTVHEYHPFNFTHQGSSWTQWRDVTGVTCCNEDQKSVIRSYLDAHLQWSRDHGYPLYIGEWGSINKADLDSRVEYTSIMREEMDSRGYGWGYWEFASQFGIYNRNKDEWITPLLDALNGKDIGLLGLNR